MSSSLVHLDGFKLVLLQTPLVQSIVGSNPTIYMISNFW